MKFGSGSKKLLETSNHSPPAVATFIDAPAAHDRNIADHEPAAEDTRTRLDMCVVTHCEECDVGYFTKVRGPFAYWNTFRDGLDALKSILKWIDANARTASARVTASHSTLGKFTT
jgi:hypothetical protein